MNKFYLTTAIDYVNGAPHIGHAYEKIAADVIVRHFKQRINEVFFLTGSDEHGIKIEKTSKENNMSPQEFCDMNASKFIQAWKDLDIDYDKYIRTTDSEHKKRVQKIFKRLLAKGDVYKHSYTGLYCAGCESFLNERDLNEDGLCPDHMQKPEEVTEENYFFKLSKYKDQIKQHILDNPEFILPAFRASEVLNQLENIEDISVSRSKSSVTWGIDVPGDEDQIIYVWIDALSNYITALGYDDEAPDELYKKFWPANVHLIGKDILKFHSIYWIGLLLALDIPLPKTIFGHGWITIDKTKMSKSLGNVIDPKDILDAFELETADAFRYFMMVTAQFGKDGNYSDEEFKSRANADLANNMGNLLNRTLSMLCKYFDGEIKPEFVTTELKQQTDATVSSVIAAFNTYELTQAAENIIGLVDSTNKYVNDKAPWTIAKDESKLNECGQVLYNVLEAMRHVAVLIYPYCPNIAQSMWKQLACEGSISDFKLESLKWGDLKVGKIADKDTVKPVFLRMDSELAGDKKKS